MIRLSLLLALFASGSSAFAAQTTATIRLALLQYGTVSWEIDTLQHYGLDRKLGVQLAITPVGSPTAALVALQGGAVDAVVSDWIWVARQRAEGRPWTFVPYSLTVGSLLVSPTAGIERLQDLAGKRLGVAGGPVDKSWLLLRAYGRQRLGQDLAELAEPTYGAPPLLNELALRGDLPALVNYWHYAARLEAQGFQPLISMQQVLEALGVEQPVPLLGWVFDEAWAAANSDTLLAFLRASYQAKRILAESDEEWQRLRPLTRAEDERTLHALRDAYRAGIPQRFGEAERAAAAEVLGILVEVGGSTLVGSATGVPAGTFWDGFQPGP